MKIVRVVHILHPLAAPSLTLVVTMTTSAAAEQQQQRQSPNRSVLSKHHERRCKSFEEPKQKPSLRVPPAFQASIASGGSKSRVPEEIQSPCERSTTASSPSISGRRASWRQTSPRVNHKLTFQVLKEAAEQARGRGEQRKECQIDMHLAARPFAQHAAQQAKARGELVVAKRQHKPQRTHFKAACIQAIYRDRSAISIQALYRGMSARIVMEEENEEDMLRLSLLEDTNHTSTSNTSHSISSIIPKHSQTTTMSELYDDSFASLDDSVFRIDKDTKRTPNISPAKDCIQQQKDTNQNSTTPSTLASSLERRKSKFTSSFSSCSPNIFCMDLPMKPCRKLTPTTQQWEQKLRNRFHGNEAGNSAPFPCSPPMKTKSESTIRASEAGHIPSFPTYFMDSPVFPPRRTLSPKASHAEIFAEVSKSHPPHQPLRKESLHNPKSTFVTPTTPPTDARLHLPQRKQSKVVPQVASSPPPRSIPDAPSSSSNKESPRSVGHKVRQRAMDSRERRRRRDRLIHQANQQEGAVFLRSTSHSTYFTPRGVGGAKELEQEDMQNSPVHEGSFGNLSTA